MSDDRLRLDIEIVAIFAVCLAIGCSSHIGARASESPIVGTWILNIARTSPAAAANPALAKTVTGKMVFSPDGTYRDSATFNGHTNEGSGKWRTVGSDVYIKPDDSGREGHLELRGDDLIDYALHEPGSLIYERQR